MGAAGSKYPRGLLVGQPCRQHPVLWLRIVERVTGSVDSSDRYGKRLFQHFLTFLLELPQICRLIVDLFLKVAQLPAVIKGVPLPGLLDQINKSNVYFSNSLGLLVNRLSDDGDVIGKETILAQFAMT